MYGTLPGAGGSLRRGAGLEPGGNESTNQVDTSSGKQMLAVSDTVVRHGFIRKVYGIVGVQLCLTALIASVVLRFGQAWMPTHPTIVMSLMLIALAGSIGTMCVFQCCPEVMHRSPTNYAIMLLFTVCEGLLIGFICVTYTLDTVLLAVGVTAFIVLALTLFACQTQVDFTGFGPYLFAGSMCLMAFGMFFWIGSMLGLGATPLFKPLYLAYSCMGTLLFSFYIVFHTQQIVGGKHRLQFSVDDYAVAAINLYIDIIQLFLFILRMVGRRR
jgi:FtsH-binding integral membrane protein